MFGYLQVDKAELKVREWEAYKSVYCGLCRQMGRDYSFLSRLALSYDCTYYAMLLMSVHRSCTGFDSGRCRFNPLKKCGFARCTDESYSKAAALSVISVYYKLLDDIRDSGFFKRLGARFLKLFFGHWRRKAVQKYPKIDTVVSDMLQMQFEAESADNTSCDAAAHPTAQMLAEVFALDAADDMERRVFREFGYQLGRWVYFMDAADDYFKDKKHGAFNPFSAIEEKELPDFAQGILNQSLARAYDAYQLITIRDFKGILDNMILLGFPLKQNSVLAQLREEMNE
ncbi:MAG: hypothetical protein II709_01080 [Ruminococcus sp.]|nr:hypothetical protein [Ruminococcus sp.]